MLDQPALAAELTLASLTDALARLENVRARKQLLRRIGQGPSRPA
jgi:hypothetical protein